MVFSQKEKAQIVKCGQEKKNLWRTRVSSNSKWTSPYSHPSKCLLPTSSGKRMEGFSPSLGNRKSTCLTMLWEKLRNVHGISW